MIHLLRTGSVSYTHLPRASGTFPHAITYFVREKKILTLEEAIHKMTGLTAEYLLVKNKGLIRDGYDADLVIFDYDRLQDTATYLSLIHI